jgi:hypothetical protein
MITEYDINVTNTQAFIAADPSVITIKRDTYISDGAGGRKKSGAPLLLHVDKTVRMVPQGADNATSNPITQTTNGQLDRPDYVLVGEPGLALQRNDYFDCFGETYEVISIRRSPLYETKADVKVRKDL